MKIGILTLPLINNYGGILQAYALQKALEKLGHEVWLINRRKSPHPISYYLRIRIRLFCIKMLGGKRDWVLSEKQRLLREKEVSKNTIYFINKYIQPQTKSIFCSEELKNLNKFDAYVVGSDQVWRPKYASNIYDYFLDFLGKDTTSKRVAYGASFGTDSWEYAKDQEERCKELINRFDAVSVREDSAVSICKTRFAVKAKHVLDPTMLLTAEEYITNVGLANEKKSDGNLMVYVLDINPEKEEFINRLGEKFDIFNISLKSDKIKVAPRVEAWLRGFYDADFVITDSFHGTVFSILFNKPFIAIGNAKRGLSRFKSLLQRFGLEDRLVLNSNLKKEILEYKDIDWKKVNSILAEERSISLSFIHDSLK